MDPRLHHQVTSITTAAEAATTELAAQVGAAKTAFANKDEKAHNAALDAIGKTAETVKSKVRAAHDAIIKVAPTGPIPPVEQEPSTNPKK